MSSGQQLKLAGSACATCPARGGKCLPPEPAIGGRPKLTVVGEDPSRADIEQGRVFAGSTGRLLARGLKTLGLSRADIHWTNAVLCQCAPQDLAKARVACAERLRSELAASGAPVVMPLGPLGLHSSLALSRKPQILKWRGSVSQARFEDPQGKLVGAPFVMPTIHPLFVMRAPKWGPVLEIDVARVGRVMRDGFVAPEEQPGRELLIPQTIAELRDMLARLRGPEASFDVETVGLGPTYTALVCYGLSDGVRTVVVPWSQASNGQESYWVDGGIAAREATNQVLARMVAVTHNGPAFDHVVAARYGLRIQQWDDTLLGAHALAGHMPKNLAHVVTLYLDVPPWKQLEDRGVNIDRLHVYNGRDCLYTMLAREAQRKELAAA